MNRRPTMHDPLNGPRYATDFVSELEAWFADPWAAHRLGPAQPDRAPLEPQAEKPAPKPLAPEPPKAAPKPPSLLEAFERMNQAEEPLPLAMLAPPQGAPVPEAASEETSEPQSPQSEEEERKEEAASPVVNRLFDRQFESRPSSRSQREEDMAELRRRTEDFAASVRAQFEPGKTRPSAE